MRNKRVFLLMTVFLFAQIFTQRSLADDDIKSDIKGTATNVGHAFRDGGKAVGHATRDGAKAIGHSAKNATHSVTHSAKTATDKKPSPAPKTAPVEN